ncbi:MAG: DMT family transporter [Clostridiales bacterium]|nr:DMT family transporter [Clostridiales bacterium]
METVQKKSILGMAAAMSGNIIFGFTFVFTKHILNAGMSAYALLSWRLVIATLTMLALAACGVLKINFKGKKPLRLLPLGLCEPCLYFICESIGIARTTASESGTIIAFIPICVLLFSRLVFKERHTTGQFIGVLLSVTGIICVVSAGGLSASLSVSGYACLFGAVIIAGFYNMGVRRLVGEFSSAEITFGTNIMGLVFFVLLAGGEGLIKGHAAVMWLLPIQDPLILLYIILLAVGASAGAFMLIIYAISKIGPTRSSSFAGFSTITSILFGLIILGERMLTWQIAGAALIIAGVWGANHFARHAPPAPVSTAEGR